MGGVEADVSELGLLLLNNQLLTDRLVFVDVQIEDKHLAIGCDGGKDCGRVWCPRGIANGASKVVYE